MLRNVQRRLNAKAHVLAAKESFNLDKVYLHKNSMLSYKRNVLFTSGHYTCSYIFKTLFSTEMTMTIFKLRTSYFIQNKACLL